MVPLASPMYIPKFDIGYKVHTVGTIKSVSYMSSNHEHNATTFYIK